MAELFKTRCTKGFLIIYEDRVSLELSGPGVHNVNSISADQITGVEVKTKIASILGIGGVAAVSIYGTGNQKLEANMVKLAEATKAEEIINETIRKGSKPTDNLNDLEKLAELKDKGIITQEEFKAKKKQILGI